MPPVSHTVSVGEEGFFTMRYTGADLSGPVVGEYTGAEYRFHERRVLLVDKRDAVFMMGPDCEIVE